MTGFLNNAHTAVTRRFKNIVTDDRTHSIFELILGTTGGNGEAEAIAANTATAASLAAEASELPIADDEDSGSDEDCLADRPWPSRGTALVSPRDSGPASPASGRGARLPAASSPLAARRPVPPAPPRLLPDLTSPQESAVMPPVEQLSVEVPDAVTASPADAPRGAAADAEPVAPRPSTWVSEPAISTSAAPPHRPSRAASGFQSPSRSHKSSMSDLPMARHTGGSGSIDVAGMDLLRFDDNEGTPSADGSAVVAAPLDPFAAGLAANVTSPASGEAPGGPLLFDGGVVPGATPGNPFFAGAGMGVDATHSSAGRLSSFVEIAPVDPGEGGGQSPPGRQDPFALADAGAPAEAGSPVDPLL